MLLGRIYRFFAEIRRPPGAHFAPSPPSSRRARAAHLARNHVHSQHFRTRNPASTRNGCRVEFARNLYAPRATDLRCCAWLQPAHTGAPHVPAPRAQTLTCTRRSPYQRQRRSRPCQSSLSARQQYDPVRTQDPSLQGSSEQRYMR